MVPLHINPLFDRLDGAERVLVVGAGGGFDVYAGLPVALALARLGKRVHLGNLTFSDLTAFDGEWVTDGLALVTPESAGSADYFPERTLARWLAVQQLEPVVYAIRKAGVRPVRAAYEKLCQRLKLDAIVLVDGGTDILMRGDESGLGTPAEDLTSVAAVAKLDVPVRLVVSIGFGVDRYHGVSHAQVLENIAEIDSAGGYLGAFSVPRKSPDGVLFLDAVDHATLETPGRPSIVNGSIAAAIRGEFGDVQFSDRTANSELFINPLMALYFAFELDAVARNCYYLPLLEDTETSWQVAAAIESYCRSVKPRPARSIPL